MTIRTEGAVTRQNSTDLQLHEQIISGHFSIDVKLRKRYSAIFVHRLQNVPGLKTDRFKCGSDYVLFRGVRGDTAYYPKLTESSLLLSQVSAKCNLHTL